MFALCRAWCQLFASAACHNVQNSATMAVSWLLCRGCKGMTYKAETNTKITAFLDEGSPIPGVIEPIVFTHINPKIGGDAQLLIKKEKGIIVTSDAVQSYDQQDLRLSKLDNNAFARVIMAMMGFKGRANTVPLFFKVRHEC